MSQGDPRFITAAEAQERFGGGGGTPGGSDTQAQFNNASAFGGATNITYDLTQLPGSGSSTHAVTIGPPESQLPAFLRGWAAPEHTLFTANKVAGIGYNTATAIETFSDDNYAAGLIVTTMISPATSGSVYGIQTGNVIAGSGTVQRSMGYEINGPTITGTPTLENSIGIQIDDQNPTNIATNTWGIFIAPQTNGVAIQVGGGAVDLGPQATSVGSLISAGTVAGLSHLVFPDVDPHIVGAAYWVAGVLTKSAG